ncbi:MAG: RecX family transcriptional regulator [Alicyclobacillus sp.]|nr:RecX family transcriptional regulator [Alicyclobacillus sp.]
MTSDGPKADGEDRILALQPVPGRPDWVRVVLERGEAAEIPLRDWVELCWRTGQALSGGQAARLAELAELGAAEETALRFLQARARTVSEVSAHLRRRGISPGVAAEVVRRLRERGWLDDAAYARQYAEGEGERRSRLELAWRLRQRGVPRDLVDQVLSGPAARMAEQAAARRAAERYWRTHSGVPPAELFPKLVAHLQRRGFPRAIALEAARWIRTTFSVP